MNPEVSRYLGRVAYVTGADAAMRARLAALEDTETIGALPGWVPRAPAAVLAEFRRPPPPATAAYREEDHPRGEHGKWSRKPGAARRGGEITRPAGRVPPRHRPGSGGVAYSLAEFTSGTEYPTAPGRLPAGLKRGPQKQCYANTAAAMLEHGLGYAEGFAYVPKIGLWVHHAWNVDGQGRAVDLTLPPERGVRHVGHEYTAEEVLDAAAERGRYDAMDPGLITLLDPSQAEPGPAPDAGAAGRLKAAAADPAVLALITGTAAFREADHPRIPGGKGGGRFTKKTGMPAPGIDMAEITALRRRYDEAVQSGEADGLPVAWPDSPTRCADDGAETLSTADGDVTEFYDVRDDVWQQAGAGKAHLCIGSLEKRLGRRLTRADFTAAPVNDLAVSDNPRFAWSFRSPRLQDRLRGDGKPGKDGGQLTRKDGGGPGTGADLLAAGEGAAAEFDPLVVNAGTGDPALNAIFGRQGFNALPARGDLTQAERDGGLPIHRGVAGPDGATPDQAAAAQARYADQFKNSPRRFIGQGIWANGDYFSTSRDTAADYADGNPAGVIDAVLDPAARVADGHALMREWQDYTGAHPGHPALDDLGRYAALRGYDAIRYTSRVVVLNRGAVEVAA